MALHINSKGLHLTADDINIPNFGVGVPEPGANYFVVVEGDEVYYNEHEYLALWIIAFGFLICVPVIVIIVGFIILCFKNLKH